MSVLTLPPWDPRRRAFDLRLGFARLAILGLLFLLTGPPMTTIDDDVGEALGIRWAFTGAVADELDGPAPDLPAWTTTLSATTRPGSPLSVTTSDATTTCAIRDGDRWVPLDAEEEFAGVDVGVGWGNRRPHRGPYLDVDRLTTIHEFVATAPVTELTCTGYDAGRRDVLNADGARRLAFWAVVAGARLLWLTALTSPLWIPILRARLRARRS